MEEIMIDEPLGYMSKAGGGTFSEAAIEQTAKLLQENLSLRKRVAELEPEFAKRIEYEGVINDAAHQYERLRAALKRIRTESHWTTVHQIIDEVLK